MEAIIKGRVSSCKQKIGKSSGKEYYQVAIVQGEGSSFVRTIFVISKNPVSLGESELPVEIMAKEMSVFAR